MYGTQAVDLEGATDGQFENDEKMYGTQAKADCNRRLMLFENDVKTYSM